MNPPNDLGKPKIQKAKSPESFLWMGLSFRNSVCFASLWLICRAKLLKALQ
jgi:hypothetical protein